MVVYLVAQFTGKFPEYSSPRWPVFLLKFSWPRLSSHSTTLTITPKIVATRLFLRIGYSFAASIREELLKRLDTTLSWGCRCMYSRNRIIRNFNYLVDVLRHLPCISHDAHCRLCGTEFNFIQELREVLGTDTKFVVHVTA